jgi:hypothetical protein
MIEKNGLPYNTEAHFYRHIGMISQSQREQFRYNGVIVINNSEMKLATVHFEISGG